MAKTEFLQIRLSPQDRDRVIQVANANHLEPSTWARQVILRALDDLTASKDLPIKALKGPRDS